MSGTSYGHLRYVYNAARDETLPEDLRALALEEMDRVDAGGGPSASASRLRSRVRARRDAQEAKAAATSDEPAEAAAPPKRTTSPAAERVERIREMAGQGYTSIQIAEAVGVGADHVRQRAREHDITIHADQVLGVRTRKSVDSNRVVRETVSTLDALTTGIGLINFDELDQTQMWFWVQSLEASIRELNRLKKQLKERTQ